MLFIFFPIRWSGFFGLAFSSRFFRLRLLVPFTLGGAILLYIIHSLQLTYIPLMVFVCWILLRELAELGSGQVYELWDFLTFFGFCAEQLKYVSVFCDIFYITYFPAIENRKTKYD